jgi:hypothetical protein
VYTIAADHDRLKVLKAEKRFDVSEKRMLGAFNRIA